MATNEKLFRTQDEFLQNSRTSLPRPIRECHPQSMELGIGDDEESLDTEFLSAVWGALLHIAMFNLCFGLIYDVVLLDLQIVLIQGSFAELANSIH